MPIYEYECQDCGSVDEEYAVSPHQIMESICASCGGRADRIYSLAAVKVFESFTTRNILPGGEPITVRSNSQLRQLETDHQVKMAPNDYSPPETRFGQQID